MLIEFCSQSWADHRQYSGDFDCITPEPNSSSLRSDSLPCATNSRWVRLYAHRPTTHGKSPTSFDNRLAADYGCSVGRLGSFVRYTSSGCINGVNPKALRQRFRVAKLCLRICGVFRLIPRLSIRNVPVEVDLC